MKTLVLVLAAVALASSIFSIRLWRQLQSERQTITELRIQQEAVSSPRALTASAHTDPGLAEELGLSELEANQLFELIAGRALEFAESSTETIGLAEDLLMQSGREIRALLGDARFARLARRLDLRYCIYIQFPAPGNPGRIRSDLDSKHPLRLPHPRQTLALEWRQDELVFPYATRLRIE